MFRLYVFFALTLSLLAGCATTSTAAYSLPDGTHALTVKCSADPVKCFAQASSTCNTYRVVASESHAGGLVADIIPGPVTWYTMTYVCGVSDGKMPSFPFTGSPYVPYTGPSTIIQQQQQQTVIIR